MNEAATFATRLQRSALACGSVTTLLLIASAWVSDAGSWLQSLMIIAGLTTLFLVAYMLFDAALFRLIASHGNEIEGCRAVDDLLARIQLRARPEHARLVEVRMAGTTRLLLMLHLAFAIFLALFAAVATYRLWGTI